MRIPSELHGEPLYGRTRNRRTGPPARQSWRRVIRLTIVLALVVVVMRQASRPGVYQVFFPETARQVTVAPSGKMKESTRRLTANGASFQPGSESASNEQTATASNTTPDRLTPEVRQRFERWVDTKSEDELTATLASWLNGDKMAAEDNEGSVVDTEREAAFLVLTIQQKLIESAKDGTVWRAADGPALFATLAMHRSDGIRRDELLPIRTPAAVAGVLPLLQQPEVYRGDRLIARGEIVRIERVTAPDNVYGMARYWNLWLLPLDASRRPWMVVVADLPKTFDALLSTADHDHSESSADSDKQTFPVGAPRPIVDVEGEFIKRLSYQSEAGAELTPVIVGHVASYLANGNPDISTAIRAADPSTRTREDEDDEIPLWWIVAGSVTAGLLFSVWVMWRTAVLNRQLRERRRRNEVVLSLLVVIGSMAGGSQLSAQSLADLLPGYDQQRMQDIARPAQPSLDDPGINIDEIAKLVFRMDRLSDAVLQERLSKSESPAMLGDAVSVDEAIVDSRSLTVSSTLQEYLNIDWIEMVELSPIDGVPRVLLARSFAKAAEPGDRVFGVAVRIRRPDGDGEDELIVDVAGRLGWIPSQPASPADEVLSIEGVDLGRLAEVVSLDREPLSEADSPVFYPMIGAAASVSDLASQSDQLADAVRRMRSSVTNASPVDLLQNPKGFTGEWIRLQVETVRITRVAVETQQRQREIGSDHYYEIDAIGDLGKVQLQIEVPDGDPVVMENRYPVTIVTAEVPEFLTGDSGDGEQLVTTINRAIRVEGFFYRLWSYESDFMKQRGGKQFAPLVIAGVIEDLRPNSGDPMGVQAIGQIAAVAIVAAILAVVAFHFITRRGDRASRKRRY
ncbi:hypothetical protein [Rhodopirellula sp. SWK7]|uniref:hypothetical protein n=1 Tax=Rhodopirellula sp. SWK7 TaxID=595460 RepID=UPI0005C722BA|nr:hypothetical protein [Rhodopirellula sp. SWK7]